MKNRRFIVVVHCLWKKSNTARHQSLYGDIPIPFLDGNTHVERDDGFHSTPSVCDGGTVRTGNATVRGDTPDTMECRESTVDADLRGFESPLGRFVYDYVVVAETVQVGIDYGLDYVGKNSPCFLFNTD